MKSSKQKNYVIESNIRHCIGTGGGTDSKANIMLYYQYHYICCGNKNQIKHLLRAIVTFCKLIKLAACRCDANEAINTCAHHKGSLKPCKNWLLLLLALT